VLPFAATAEDPVQYIQANPLPTSDKFDPSKAPQVIKKFGDAGESVAEKSIQAIESGQVQLPAGAPPLPIPGVNAVVPLEEKTLPSIPSVSVPSVPSVSVTAPSLPTPSIPSPASALKAPAPLTPAPSVIPKASTIPDAPGSEVEIKGFAVTNGGKTVTTDKPAAAVPSFPEEKKKENIDDILKEMKILKEQHQAAPGEKPVPGAPLPEEYKKMMDAESGEGTEKEDEAGKYKTQYLPDIIYRKEYDKNNYHLPKSLDTADLERSLFDTAGAGDINGVRAILDTKLVSPDVRNNYGNTPLMNAALHDRVDTVRLLLAREANPNLQNDLGLTALHIAAEKGRTDIVKALLAMKADPNLKDYYSNTPLMFAAAGKHFGTVQALLDGGAVREARFLSELVQNKSEMKAVKYGKPPGDPNIMGTEPEPNTTPDGLTINRPYEPPPPEVAPAPEPLTAGSVAEPPTLRQEEGVVPTLNAVTPEAKPKDVTKGTVESEAKKAEEEAVPAPVTTPTVTPPAPVPTLTIPEPGSASPILFPKEPAPTAPVTAPTAPSATAPATPSPAPLTPPAIPVPSAPAAVPPPQVPPITPAAAPPPLAPSLPSATAPITAPLPLDEKAPSMPTIPFPSPEVPKTPAATTAPAPAVPTSPPPSAPTKDQLPAMPSFEDFVSPAEAPKTPAAAAPKPLIQGGELVPPTPTPSAVPELKPKEDAKPTTSDPDMDAVNQMFKDAESPAKKNEEIPAVGPQIPAELQ
jgi:hypothetical protein